MPDRPGYSRPLVIIPARFSENASALRHDAEVAPTKLLEAIWEAGGEPFVAEED
jgi:putative glutamine amidotransferase